MFFGNYLLKNNVINEEQLIEAVVTQLEDSPSIVRILKQESLLDNKEIIQAVEESVTKNKSIFDLVPKGKTAKLLSKQREHGKSFSQILIDKGFVTFSEIENHLTNYAESKSPKVPHRDEPKPELKPSPDSRKYMGVVKFNMNGEFANIFDS